MEKLISPCKSCKEKKDRKICSQTCKSLEDYCKKMGNPFECLNLGINYEDDIRFFIFLPRFFKKFF